MTLKNVTSDALQDSPGYDHAYDASGKAYDSYGYLVVKDGQASADGHTSLNGQVSSGNYVDGNAEQTVVEMFEIPSGVTISKIKVGTSIFGDGGVEVSLN